MKNERKSLFVIVTILAVAVLGLSIAYAALSTTLTARLGTVTQSQQLWAVGFAEGTVAGTPSNSQGSSTSDITCSNATVTTSQASVAGAIVLGKPGDTCTYQLKIQNTGTIDANLSTIAATQPQGVTCNVNGASMVCDNLTYKLTTDAAGQTLLTANRLLEKSNGELTVYLIATYTGATVSGDDITHSGVEFTLTYNQA